MCNTALICVFSMSDVLTFEGLYFTECESLISKDSDSKVSAFEIAIENSSFTESSVLTVGILVNGFVVSHIDSEV